MRILFLIGRLLYEKPLFYKLFLEIITFSEIQDKLLDK